MTTAPSSVTSANMSSTDPELQEQCANGFCLNQATCNFDIPDLLTCNCRSGFQGTRCEITYIDFIYSEDEKAPTKPWSSEVIIGISIASILVIAMIVTGFVTWRKCVRIREKRRWVKWQESRSQSKVTIEGFTIVEPTPTPGKHRGFGLHLLKSLNLFAIGRHGNNNNNTEEEAAHAKDPENCSSRAVKDTEAGLASAYNPSTNAASVTDDSLRHSNVTAAGTPRNSQVAVVSDKCDVTMWHPRDFGDQSQRGQGRAAPQGHGKDVCGDLKVVREGQKSARYSLPNLASPYTQRPVVARTRRLSFAPTLREVIPMENSFLA